MGTTLTGTTPQDTYDSLIKVTDNGPLSGTAKYLSDGLGNDSALALSTQNAGIKFIPSAWASGYTAMHVGNGGSVYSANSSLNIYLANNTYFDGTNFKYIANGYAGLFGLEDGGFVVATAASGTAAANATISKRLIVTNTGNVGIGTSAPDNVLDLGQNTAGRSLTWDNQINAIATYSSGDLMLANNFYGSTASDSFLTSTTATFGAAGIRVSATGGPSTGGYVGFFVNAAAAKTAGTAFTPTEVCRVTPDGLTFNGDTAAANALDDYEEGTWTMGVEFSGASVGATYVLTQGTYTKIGRQVTVNGFLVLSSKGSSTGNAAITGLPFAVGNATGNYAAATLAYITNITFADTLQGYPDLAQTQITLIETTNAGVRSPLTDADFADNSEVMVSMTYFV